MQFLPQLIAAMVMVESGGNMNAIGDGGRAYGCLQIHQAVLDDVNAVYKPSYRLVDALNPVIARRIFRLYLRIYAPKNATPEQCARIWNGGPRGHIKESTKQYWGKVRSHLPAKHAKGREI